LAKKNIKYYFDSTYGRLVKDDGTWFFVYENGKWVRNRYYEGILIGDCWCEPITSEQAEKLMKGAYQTA
jgi:hypothetical protein